MPIIGKRKKVKLDLSQNLGLDFNCFIARLLNNLVWK